MPRSRFLLPLAALVAAVGLAPADDKEVADLEKKIAEMKAKLADLKKAAPAAPAGKKALTIADADTWRSVRGAVLANDGKWFAHRVGPAEGEGEVILRAVADGKETKFPAGGGFGSVQFSADSKWLAFGVSPYTKPGSPSAGPRPKPKVVLVNLATAEKTEIESATSFEFSGKASTHLAFRKAGEAPAAPTAGQTGPPAPASHTGTDLVLRELATGVELVFGNVADYSFDKPGKWLVTVIDAAGQIGNGVQLRDMTTGTVTPIESARATYRGLSWNDETTAFTVTKGVEEAGYDAKAVSVLGFADLGPKPTRTVYDPKADAGFPKDMGITQTRPATWTDGRDAFVFGIVERKKKEEPKKEAAPAPKAPDATTAPPTGSGRRGPPGATGFTRPTSSADAKPDLVIWHWKDERLQPMQQVQAAADKAQTSTAVYRIADKKFIRLGDDNIRRVTITPKSKFAVGQDVKPYEYMSNLDGRRYADVYATDLKTGDKKKVLTKARYTFAASPTGTHLLHYDDGHFFALDLATGKSVNLTEKVQASFVDVEDDHNVVKPPQFPVGWARDGTAVLLTDGWDIWAVKADGSGGTNLTVNGKADGIRYGGFYQFEPEPKPGLDLSKPAYVTLFGERTKKDGLAKLEPGKPGATRLLWADASYGVPTKARDADVWAFTKGTAVEYPDYYLTDGTFADPKKASDANPQQKNYKWTPGVKLVEYTGTAGRKLQGTIYLPADYEPGKRYPTVVYIYEKLTQNTHRYSPPSYRGGFNVSVYTSNGYAVFQPDISYRINDPGKSSMECILPALDAAVATGIVDGDKVALHGHSWGGYQTAFAVTQTNRFKAAIAGAPLTDLVSMYSSVYWNSGSANQPIFESSQGRFTGGYWEQQEAYIRNSPVYFAQQVKTPLLLLHNDKDGAVDFTQGIEYYNTLRRLQKPVVMLQYKGENHGLAKPENQKDYAARMREFFDHHLKGAPAPDWWKDGVPHLKMDDHLKGRKP